MRRIFGFGHAYTDSMPKSSAEEMQKKGTATAPRPRLSRSPKPLRRIKVGKSISGDKGIEVEIEVGHF